MCFDRPHHSLGSWAWTQRLGFSLLAVVIADWRRSLFSSETSKAERRSSGDHGSIWDSWPIAFSGSPRGPRVLRETTCPRHTARLTEVLRLALEPECLANRTATAEVDSQFGSGLDPRHSSCLWFQMPGVEAHSFLPDDQRDGGDFSG